MGVEGNGFVVSERIVVHLGRTRSVHEQRGIQRVLKVLVSEQPLK